MNSCALRLLKICRIRIMKCPHLCINSNTRACGYLHVHCCINRAAGRPNVNTRAQYLLMFLLKCEQASQHVHLASVASGLFPQADISASKLSPSTHTHTVTADQQIFITSGHRLAHQAAPAVTPVPAGEQAHSTSQTLIKAAAGWWSGNRQNC